MKKLIALMAFVAGLLVEPATAQNIKGTYAIKNVVTGMLLRVMDANSKNETPIVAYSPTNWKCMTWNFEQVEGQTYQLKNLFTGKTFQPAETPVKENVVLHQQPISAGNSAQQWEFIPQAKNTFLIKLKDTDLYITPSNASGAINATTILAKKLADSKLQHWLIYEQHPTM